MVTGDKQLEFLTKNNNNNNKILENVSNLMKPDKPTK